MPFMLDYASQCYDLVFVDLTKGTDVKEVNDILNKSDVIVVTMNQDKEIIRKMEKAFSTLKILQEKPVIPVFARYDQFVAYNDRNIFREFNFKLDKRETYTVPYNSQYFDAMNSGNSLNFFVNHMREDLATTREGYMISESIKIKNRLFKILGNKVASN